MSSLLTPEEMREEIGDTIAAVISKWHGGENGSPCRVCRAISKDIIPIIMAQVEQAKSEERARLAELARFSVKTTGGISSMNADYWSRLKWALQEE